MLNGSAGDFFPAYRDKTFVDLFTPDLCRLIYFFLHFFVCFLKTKLKFYGSHNFKYSLLKRLIHKNTIGKLFIQVIQSIISKGKIDKIYLNICMS